MHKSFQTLAILTAVVCCFSILQGCTTYTYPWKDTEAMRRALLKITPLGSSLSEVEQKLKARHLDIKKSLNTGFVRWVDGKDEVIGQQSIWTHLGGYRSGFFESTSVTAYWGFDENGKLIEIWVRKQKDGL